MADDIIERVTAWEALDSRGTPTLGCAIYLADGGEGRAIVPSGASTGSHDARELRDDSWRGTGVRGSVETIRSRIGPALVGTSPSEVDTLIDDTDPTPDLRDLGVHAALGLSVAARRAEAAAAGVPLYALLSGGRAPHMPRPMVNIISGGAHTGGSGRLDIQDILVVPLGAETFADAIERAWAVRRCAADVAVDQGMPASLVADEGGLGIQLPSTEAGLDLVTQAIERAGLAPGTDAALAVDVAANQLWDGTAYRLENRRLDAGGLVDEIAAWAERFPLVSVEDPVHDEDWDGWKVATRRLGHLQLIGDDLFATSSTRVAEAAARNIANAVLIKPNQRGTLSRAGQAVDTAKRAGYATVVSARSGDTEDDWLADLAVGWAAGQIKVGSTMRSERNAKWNRLLQIEAEAATT